MRGRFVTLAVTALTAGSLAACGLGSNDAPDVAAPPATAAADSIKGEVSLQTWALKPKFTSYVEGVVKGFEAKYPGVTVKWLDQPGDGYSEKVLSQAASGELPDVTNLPPDFALPLVKQGLLLDVAKADPKLDADYVEGGTAAYRYAGTEGTYGYPWYLNSDVNYWNSDLLTKYGLDPKKLPANLDELVTQARIMKDKSGGKMYLMSRKPGLGDLANRGVPILSEDGKSFVFNTEDAVKVLDTYRDAFKQGLLPRDVLTDKYLGNSELFKKQQVAWTTGGGNMINDLKTDNPTLAAKVVPSMALDTPPLYVQGLSVSSTSKNPTAALALARWVTSPENQAEFAKLVPGIFPSTKASADDPFFTKTDGTNAGDAKVIAFETLAKAKMLQPVVVDQAMNDVIGQQFSLAISGEITSKEALDKAVAKCNELLKS